MERISNRDFLVVENFLKEAASDDSLLVIYETRGIELWERKTLKQAAESGYQLETLTTDYRTKQRTVRKVRLPSDIGGRLLEVTTMAMTKKVYSPSPRSFTLSIYDEPTIWLRQRVDSEHIISGMVLVSRCGHGDVSTPPFLELMRRLEMCAMNDVSDGPPLLKLDLAITALRSSYPD